MAFVGTALWDEINAELIRNDTSLAEFERLFTSEFHPDTLKRIKNMESLMAHKGDGGIVRDSTIDHIANFLKISPTDFKSRLETRIKENAQQKASRTSFEAMFTFAKGCDGLVIPAIRMCEGNKVDANKSISYSIYDALKKSQADSGAGSLDAFLVALANPVVMKRIIQTIPEPDITVTVDEQFEYIDYKVEEGSLRVNHPHMLWDCPCYGKGRVESCPFHSEQNKNLGLIIEQKFMGTSKLPPLHKKNIKPATVSPEGIMEGTYANKLVLIKWGELSFYWTNLQDLWPPSIDPFTMLNTIRESGLHNRKNLNRLIDIGTGVGFLGTALASLNTFKTVCFTDWILMPLLFSSINWFNNLDYISGNGTPPSVSFLMDLNADRITKARKKGGVAVCNPPYLPIPKEIECAERVSLSSTVAGTELLCSVINNARDLATETYINFSDLTFKDLSQEQAQKLTPVGDPRDVPFRVMNTHKDYMEWLIAQRGLRTKKRAKHRYWHNIQTFKIAGK